ncbi:orphan [Acanthamoeba polyphaga mimivirus]|nr:orphan [Mimivirus reunion]WMV62049.1 orphan [Mimivirus sp.]WMV63026.1 orphan [Acanthamoeba polyphaga mimivirus]WMV64003.1 orphan [Mimivirus sp.]
MNNFTMSENSKDSNKSIEDSNKSIDELMKQFQDYEVSICMTMINMLVNETDTKYLISSLKELTDTLELCYDSIDKLFLEKRKLQDPVNQSIDNQKN